MKKYLIFTFFIAIILISGCTAINDLFTSTSCEDEIEYSEWTECNNNVQQRVKSVYSCADDSLVSREVEQRSCVMPCALNWSCINWSECSKEGIQTRSCINLLDNNCTSLIPSVAQKCQFNNPCLNISESNLKEECNSLVYNSNKYCYNLTGAKNIDLCLFSYAYIYSDFNTCDLIEDSIARNSCKAAIYLDKSYCNILPPENRSDCNYELDMRYQYLANINHNPSLCNNVQNPSIKSNCLKDSQYYENYKDNISKCANITHENNSINYQTSRACYVYHIKNSNYAGICDDVGYFIKNDCKALIANNLSFCYDQSGYQRDWCLANFAYYYNDVNLCREASSEENCLYTIGYWFKEKNYCMLIGDQNKKDFCISSYVYYCEENIDNCRGIDYCKLLTSAIAKNNCILKSVTNEIKYNKKVW